MTAKVLHIQEKKRTPANTVAKLEDFDYQEGETIDSTIIINNPQVTIYCLDPENQRAIFVETPAGLDLSQPPFFYHAQYNNAQRLIAVPLTELAELTKEITPIEELVFIYSMGRSGSTLLSKIFNQLDSVLSLSEPDVFSQLVGMRNPDGSNDEQVAGLIKICATLLSQQTNSKKYSHCVIKLRSFGINLGDLMNHVFPEAKVIFLYRNAEDVVKSSMRSFVFMSSMLPQIQKNIELYTRFIHLLKKYANDIDWTDANATDLYITSWLSVMERYLLLYQQGIPSFAIRYEDLITKKQEVVTTIFEKCNLPIIEVEKACEVFSKDAQIGSNLSQETTRKNEQEQEEVFELHQKIKHFFNQHPELKNPNFIAPGTICYNQ